MNFNVTNSSGATITSITSGTVSIGAASVTLSLTNFGAGVYGVDATYNPASTAPNCTSSKSAIAGVLRVISPAPIPTLTGFTGPVAGMLTFLGTASSAGNIVTLMTTDLAPSVIWVPVQANVVAGGAFNFSISQGTRSQAFYRLMGQ